MGKIVRVIDSKGLEIDPGDYNLEFLTLGSGIERGITTDPNDNVSDSWFPLWFLNDNNVTYVIL